MKAGTEELFAARQKDADRNTGGYAVNVWKHTMLLTTAAEPNCGYCFERNAEIFQVTANYCLKCWQEETHPDV